MILQDRELWTLYCGRKFLLKGTWHTKLSGKDPKFKAETTAGMLTGNTIVKVALRGSVRAKRVITGPECLSHLPRDKWERSFAYSIKMGYMKKCCNKGCIICEFTGWIGEVKEGDADYQTTNCDRTLQRWCDIGKVRCFRINKRRLIV